MPAYVPPAVVEFGRTITALLDGTPAVVEVHGRFDETTLVVHGPDGRVRLVPAPSRPAPPPAARPFADLAPGDMVITTDCDGSLRCPVRVTRRGYAHIHASTESGRAIFVPDSLIIARATAEEAARFAAPARAKAPQRVAPKPPAAAKPAPSAAKPTPPRPAATQLALF